MKVAILVENTSKGDFKAEHGLSFYVEHKGKKYLIDTGKSGLYLENARKLNIDISDVDGAFLSHGHYDHSGGFEEFFNLNKWANVYLQEECSKREYIKIVDSKRKYIGIPRGLLKKYPDRFSYVDGFKKLDEGVYVCPHFRKGLSERGKRTHMYSISKGEILPDDFSHEQTVIFEEDDHLYLFNSCSHGGVDTIIEEVRETFPNRKIKAFFGGFHLMGTDGVDSCGFSETEIGDLAADLLKSTDATFYTGHCTGNVASKWLKDILKERFVEFHSGMVIDL